MATIKAIEGRSVHQIQSGQVIVDLTSVVKELVENSLDAGATSIEVRFKNQGLDSIEVLDSGKGIAPEDFETIALKHYTSKLSSYEDLTGLSTFGFRGEALSSLCALSKFHIITARSEDGAIGKKLDFETSGKLKGASVVAAQRGTTVSVENLFYNLPVRRKELEKNIKREYAKVIGQLHAYACISVGVRFAVSNQMPKGKKVALFSTKSNTTTKENITNVFGAKTLLALVKLDLRLEMEPSKGPSTQVARNWSTRRTDCSMEVEVQGHISKPIFGEGRQAPDRQMFFVNSRPCGLPQVSKAFNEVYKSFNVSQSPFIFANLKMDTNAYDVNVSPDKRSIMLHDQTALLESLKSALTGLFENTDHTVPQSQLPNKKLPAFKPLNMPRQASMEEGADWRKDGSAAEESAGEASDNERTSMPLRRPSSNGTPRSLTQNWVGRDTKTRGETPGPKKNATLTKDKQKLVDNMKAKSTSGGQLASPVQYLAREDEQDGEDAEYDRSAWNIHGETPIQGPMPELNSDQPPNPEGSLHDDLFSQRPAVPALPRPVQDFNALMDRTVPLVDESNSSTLAARKTSLDGGQEAVQDDRSASEGSRASEEKADGSTVSQSHAIVEPVIPAIAPGSQKATPGPVQDAFDRMRPKRMPMQTAEITIGDQTTTTVIGSDSPFKRRKTHRPDDSQAVAKFGGSPSVAPGLRTFAAPGSQMLTESSQLSAAAVPPRSPNADGGESIDNDLSTRDREDSHADREASSSPARGLRAHVSQRDAPISDALDVLVDGPADEAEYDGDYLDEEEKKMREDEKVARLMQEAELAAAQPSEENLRRASQVLKNGGNRKEATLNLATYVGTNVADIAKQSTILVQTAPMEAQNAVSSNAIVRDELDNEAAESRLSLTVSKDDFERMTIIGQFNLGFVLAIRPTSGDQDEDELFIIDQHAADEKYNYERLQRTVTLQNQRLVRPKTLDLTAIEEEVILNHEDSLKANGFEIEVTVSEEDDGTTARQCRLLTLPMTGEKTFDISDLEELLHLLSEAPAGSSEIPRPKKVQKVLAMRACRSSIMVGKTLTLKQMQKVVIHMGEMEKPWNCPHGRPTMRHLAGLDAWAGWQEGDMIDDGYDDGGATSGHRTDWKAWLSER